MKQKQDRWWMKKEQKKSMSKKKKEANQKRNYLAGRLIWCSAELFRDSAKFGAMWMKRVVQGTYIRSVHGEIGSKKNN